MFLLGSRVLVQPLSLSSFALPPPPKEAPSEGGDGSSPPPSSSLSSSSGRSPWVGDVKKVGKGSFIPEERAFFSLSVEEGDRVVYDGERAVSVSLEGVEYHLLEEKDLWMVLNRTETAKLPSPEVLQNPPSPSFGGGAFPSPLSFPEPLPSPASPPQVPAAYQPMAANWAAPMPLVPQPLPSPPLPSTQAPQQGYPQAPQQGYPQAPQQGYLPNQQGYPPNQQGYPQAPQQGYPQPLLGGNPQNPGSPSSPVGFPPPFDPALQGPQDYRAQMQAQPFSPYFFPAPAPLPSPPTILPPSPQNLPGSAPPSLPPPQGQLPSPNATFPAPQGHPLPSSHASLPPIQPQPGLPGGYPGT